MADTPMAPARIWARFSETDIGTQAEIRTRMWKGEPFEEGVEYIRVDLGAPDADLVAALRECADALEEEITASYPDHLLEYQHNIQKKKNDMETVDKARAALAKVEGRT